jgi:predicted ester cyclase
MMSANDEAVVRRYYEQMCNERKNELASEIFTSDHVMHDPQVQAGKGPQGMVEAISTYQTGVNGHWQIEEIFSTGDRVTVRWTGSGEHVGDVNGIPPTGKKVRVDAISIHRVKGDKIAETWEVWDTLGFLQQIGVVPA